MQFLHNPDKELHMNSLEKEVRDSLDTLKDREKDIFIKRFSGPHPAGLAGTHIHFISPATINNNLWTINYSDVIGFGSLFLSGKLSTDKYISLDLPVYTDSILR